MTFRHIYESPVVDANDPDLVGPDEWNEPHREDPRRGSLVFEECYFLGTSGIYAGGIGQAVSGTGAATSDGFGEITDPGWGAAGTGVHRPGIVILATGTTTTGRCALATTQNIATGKIVLYAGGVRFGVSIRPSALSDGTNRYTLRHGFNNSVSAESSDAVFFRYADNVNSGNWQGVSRDSGSETALDLGVAPVATGDEFQTLEFVLNDAADEIEFFIDGVSVGSISTDIPLSAPLSFVPAYIQKSLGTSNRTVSVDAYWYGFDIASR